MYVVWTRQHMRQCLGGERIKGAGGTFVFYGAARANFQIEFIDSSMEILTPPTTDCLI